MTAKRMTSRVLGLNLVADAIETPGIWPIKEYIQWRQATIAVQVNLPTTYELYTGTYMMPEASRFLRWWDQDTGWEVEYTRGEYSFKINLIGEVTYLSVGREDI